MLLSYNYIYTWASRQRPYDWSPREVIQEMPGYVVATGCTESEYKQHAWRVCFNTSEIKRVGCLNDTKAKVYVLMKLVQSEINKPLNKERK